MSSALREKVKFKGKSSSNLWQTGKSNFSIQNRNCFDFLSEIQRIQSYKKYIGAANVCGIGIFVPVFPH